MKHMQTLERKNELTAEKEITYMEEHVPKLLKR